jgi:hypothetical protein
VGPGLAGILLQFNISAQNIFFLAVIPALIATAAALGMGRIQTSFAVGKEATI